MMAVPSMLIVAPSGIVKAAVDLSMPRRSSAVRSEIGIVALDDAVLNAKICTARNFLRKISGFNPLNSFSNSGRVKNPWISSARITKKK